MINLIALLIILAIFSIFFGYMSKDLFLGLATGFFSDNAIFIHPFHEIMLDTEFSLVGPAPYNIKTLPIFVTFLSFLFYNDKIKAKPAIFIIILVLILNNSSEIVNSTNSILITLLLISIIVFFNFIVDNSKIYIRAKTTKLILYFIVFININFKIPGLTYNNINTWSVTSLINITNFFNQRLFFELFYNKFISGTALNLGGQTTKFLDKGSIEYIGPYGLEVGLLYISKKISKLDSNIITSYALYILSGLVIYLYVLNFMNIDELILITFVSVIYILLK